MNIFFVDHDPYVAASYLCNEHVGKMRIESGQMLHAVHFLHTYRTLPGAPGYPPSVLKHPCTVWAAQSSSNRAWLYDHMHGLIKEHERRFNSPQLCTKYLDLFFNQPNPMRLKSTKFSFPPQAMPDMFKHTDVVLAYRQYYRYKARSMPSFTYTNATKPEWMNE